MEEIHLLSSKTDTLPSLDGATKPKKNYEKQKKEVQIMVCFGISTDINKSNLIRKYLKQNHFAVQSLVNNFTLTIQLQLT